LQTYKKALSLDCTPDLVAVLKPIAVSETSFSDREDIRVRFQLISKDGFHFVSPLIEKVDLLL